MRPTAIPDNEIFAIDEQGTLATRRVFVPPDGTSETIMPIEALVDYASTALPGVPRVHTRWVPDAGDLARLAGGGVIWLTVRGSVPPMMMDVRLAGELTGQTAKPDFQGLEQRFQETLHDVLTRRGLTDVEVRDELLSELARLCSDLLQAQMANITEQLAAQHRGTIQELSDLVARTNATANTYQNELADVNRNYQALGRRNTELYDSITALNKESVNQRARIHGLDYKLAKAEETTAKLDVEIANQRLLVRGLEYELAKARDTIGELEANLTACQEAHSARGDGVV